MVSVYYSNTFLRSAKKLPKEQQTKLAFLIGLVKENPFHPQLHSKNLSGKLSGLYSFRITREYRVTFKFNSPTEIQLVDVSHRKDIYRT